MQPNPLITMRQRRTELTSGRKFSAEELQLMLLKLLDEAPAHGYELIKRLKDLSEDFYSPSPGVLYPALATLEALGLTAVETSGRRKKYHLTKAGEEQLTAQSDEIQELFATLNHAARKMRWLKHADSSPAEAAAATGWSPEYIATRRALQSALLSFDNSDPEEQQRVISILQNTIKEILNKS